MFTRPKKKSKLQIEIDRLILELDVHAVTSEKYGDIVDRLLKLQKIQSETTPESINPNTALTVAANIIGILTIVRHEHLNVITSKALGFIIKPR